MKRYITAFLILTLCHVFTFTSIGIAKADKEILRIGVTQYPSTLHPLIDSMLAKTYVNAMTQRPFTIHDPNWQAICMLCTELPSFENGRAETRILDDGTETIASKFTIHPDAVWGDGAPITTQDVYFTWQVGKHPMAGVSNFQLFSKDIQDIEIVDEKTFIVVLDKKKCGFDMLSDFRVLPAHIEKEIFESSPAEYKTKNTYDTDPTNPALSFGPYRIANAKHGEGFILKKNEKWWGKQPHFKEIHIKVIENSATLTAQLLSGQIDYIAGELGLTLDQALSFEKRLKRQKPGEYGVIYKPSLVYEHIDINHDNPILQPVEMRRALLKAINREALSTFLFEGKQPVAHTNVNPLDRIYNKNAKTYEYDPEAAEKLLDKLGWTKKPDGLRYNDKGEKLVITQMTTAGNKSRELVQQAIQSDWRKIGVDSVIQNQSPRVLFGQTTRQRQYKDTTMYAWMSAPENIPRTTLHSEMIPTPENNYAGQNYIGYKNPRLDTILDQLETVCEDEPNMALWHELQDIYAEDLPALPLYFRSEIHVIPKWLKGLTPTGHQYPATFWIENWRYEK